MTSTIFLGTGHYVPEKVVTNDELAPLINSSDEWIVQRTGIKERHYVDWENNPMSTSDLAAKATLAALESANLTPADIDLIIYATLSCDHAFPGDGVYLQVKAGFPVGTPCLDIRTQCTGFLYGLSIADAMIKSGTYKKVLLACSEVQSSGLDFSEEGRDVTPLFGDGAAAVILGAAEDSDGRGVLTTTLGADGNLADVLCVKYPGSMYNPRFSQDMFKEGDRGRYPQMNGRLVFKEAVTRLPVVINETLQKASLTIDDVTLFIPHQANIRINEAVAQRLAIAPEKVVHNISRYGNTTAASIPLALDETVRAGKIKAGDVVLFAGLGAGLTWGASVVRW